MNIAILGPIVKDHITVDDITKTQVGGIPYYAGNVFYNLGAEVTVFATYSPDDDEWIRKNLIGVTLRNIPVKETLEFSRVYNSKIPDVCQSIKIKYSPNMIIPSKNLLEELNIFDYIVLSPLFHDNLPPEMFTQLKSGLRKKVVHGNFGMFTYSINNKFVQMNPENLLNVAKYIDYLFLDENEIKFIGQKDSIEKSVELLQSLGTGIVIVTKGSRGSTIFTGKESYSIPAYPPKQLVDPTGAGDTYMAAFIRSLELLDDFSKIGKFASMTATISLENRCAFNKTINEVYRRLGWKNI